jgi:hypothetical protein
VHLKLSKLCLSVSLYHVKFAFGTPEIIQGIQGFPEISFSTTAVGHNASDFVTLKD